jgi:ABC-2 type transport system ATP-binding protein
VIRVVNLVKRYGSITAVRDVSFEVKGAGKTTTIKILTTLLRPTSGEVEVDGFNPSNDQREVRKRFGIVFQDPSLDDQLTAYENMDLHGALYSVPMKVRKGRIEQLLNLFQLWDRRTDLVKNFSGGMRRRLEIARCMLHTPKIILLDEPTLGLDPQTRNQLWTHIRRLNEDEGITVFLTTHYMDEAERMANRIAIIDHGAIVAQGTLTELKEKTGADSLEAAFLKLTGYSIREEQTGQLERMRRMARLFRSR